MSHLKSSISLLLAFLFLFICLSVYGLFPSDKIDSEQEYFQLFKDAEKLQIGGNFDESIKHFENSLDIATKIHDEKKQCESLIKLGTLYWNIAERAESAKKYEQALSLAQKLNLKDKQIKCQNALEIYRLFREGTDLFDSGEYRNSIESFKKAIDLAKKTGSGEHRSRCMRELSLVYWQLNDFKEFAYLNEEGLKIAKELNHKKEIGRFLNNIGIFYWKLNDYSKALKHFEDAIEIAKQEGNIENEAACINNIGAMYLEMGNNVRAEEFILKALSISKELNKTDLIIYNLNNLGEVYRRIGIISKNDEDFDKALNYYKECLKLTRKTGDRETEIKVLNNIGSVYSEKRNYSNSSIYFNLALKKAEENHDFFMKAMILTNKGYDCYNQDKIEESSKYYDEAIDLNLQIGGALVLWETYLGKAKNYDRQKNFDEALQNYKISIAHVENIRSRIQLEEFKARFLSAEKRLEPYHRLIHLLMTSGEKQQNKSEAFLYLEKARARAFLENLELSKIDITEGVDPRLLNRERELDKEYTDLCNKLSYAEPVPEFKDDILAKLDEKEKQMEILKIEIQMKSPQYAALKYPEPITFKEAQEILPDKNTAFFEYLIGEEQSYTFVVTKEGLKIFDLPKKDDIKRDVTNYIKIINDKDTHNFHLGYELFDTLVAQGLDKNIKTIIFIPDDILYYLPFETLITDKSKNEWLINKYNVAYIPSASSLNEIIHRKRSNKKKLSNDILAFGDPDFDEQETNGNGNDAIRKFFSNESINLFRLKYSGHELNIIKALFKKTKTDIFCRESANEHKFKNQKLEDYKILHFATHSILSDKNPGRSAIVLKNNEEPKEDGYLQTREIYNLKLNSSLVTLSACETGLGDFIHGEGIMGFNRAFFYAGTSALLMSLWAVNDQASYQLMERFYYHLRSSESIMDALRNVKLEMINSSAVSHPYYWAGFIVSGKADEIIFPKTTLKWLFLGISLLLIATAAFITIKFLIKKRKTSF